jgi:uncharacterized protein YeeX (DUF496 family)
MTKLYMDRNIKTDKILDAFKRAKEREMLDGVDERARREFMENLENIRQKNSNLRDKINHDEMEYIIAKMRENHTDHIDDQMLDRISAVLLDENFEF